VSAEAPARGRIGTAAPGYPTGQYGPVVPYTGEPRPLGAFILSLVAGVFVLLGGISELQIDYAISVPTPLSPEYTWLALFGLIGIGSGAIIILVSTLVYLYPRHHVLGGTLIIVLSGLSVLALSGFLVGLVLGIVGGALAVAWAPYRYAAALTGYAPYPPGGYGTAPAGSPPAGHRVCLKCGRLGVGDAKFCAYCGAPMPGP